jgi:hypothetical protein
MLLLVAINIQCSSLTVIVSVRETSDMGCLLVPEKVVDVGVGVGLHRWPNIVYGNPQSRMVARCTFGDVHVWM